MNHDKARLKCVETVNYENVIINIHRISIKHKNEISYNLEWRVSEGNVVALTYFVKVWHEFLYTIILINYAKSSRGKEH